MNVPPCQAEKDLKKAEEEMKKAAEKYAVNYDKVRCASVAVW